MNPYTVLGHKIKGRFRVGDRARPKYGWTDAVVEIVEDRGPIGHKGSYFYFVRVMRPLIEDVYLDWPEDELIPLDAPADPSKGTPSAPSRTSKEP